jgi:peptidylprolyl isomerase
MARKRDRAFALFGALLFLVTSSALTIAVIYSIVQQHNQNQAAANQAKSNTTAQTTKQPNLAGTKMQGFTPSTTPLTQLQVEDTKVGTGATVKSGDTITADYVGALVSNGVIFDASADHGGPQTFSLSQVIAGWSQGIPGMKVGGSRRLLIPAGLAYGSQSQTGIPANSDLVFDVTVTKID